MSELISIWDKLIQVLPWDWAHYGFMRLALLAALLAGPLFALLGTQVVGLRMAFFSDVLGHAALTGLALGLVAGVGRPLWAMLAWAATQAVVVTWVQRRSRLAGDTVLGVCMALSVALGVLLLSRPQAGGMTRYVGYLTGDVLSVTPGQVAGLAVALGVTVLLAARGYNALALAGLHPSLAGSRGVNVAWVQTGFAVLVAVAVTLNIQWVGILLVNAFLILPAAAARLLARNQRQYLTWAVVLSLVASVGGLITSFYLPGAASGATIVLWAVGLFGLALAARPWLAGERVAAAR